jgi:membrane-associated protein
MSIVSDVVDKILLLDSAYAYSLVAFLAFAEAAIFVGFVLPGETAVILGGVLAYRHSVSLTVMILIVIGAAILGDTVGYEVGKRYGKRILRLPVFAKHEEALEIGWTRLRERGGLAVFLGRFTAFLRAAMPGLAGTAGMPYRTFLTWNAAGGIIWGGGFTLLGFAAGASYTRLEGYAGRAGQAVLVVVLLLVAIWYVRHRRKVGIADPD